jgi:hypothetical protein
MSPRAGERHLSVLVGATAGLSLTSRVEAGGLRKAQRLYTKRTHLTELRAE